MSDELIFKGYNGDLIVGDAGVTIRRGWKGALTQLALRGEKFVPWSSIGSVDFKKAGLFTPGFVRLSYLGGWEPHAGATPTIEDENAVAFIGWFHRRKMNADAQQIRDAIVQNSGKQDARV